MRNSDFQSAGKAISTSGTTVFTSSDLPSTGVVMYHFGMTGAGNTFNSIARIRVKANGTPFYDIDPKFFRAWIVRQTQNNLQYPANQCLDNLGVTTLGTLTDFRRFTIPFCDLQQPTEEHADLYQFPPDSNVTIEIAFNGNAVAGTMFCGYTETDVQQIAYPRLYSQQLAIQTGQSAAKYPLAEEGVMRSFGVNTKGNLRTKLVLNKQQVFHMQGQPVESATFTGDSLLHESQQLNGMPLPTENSTAAIATLSTNVLTDPLWIKVTAGRTADPRKSYVEVQSGATLWAGPTNEIGIHSVVPIEGVGVQDLV